MERYGEIPKRFSKAWWPYFWYYYKIHTIVIVLLLVAITGTLVQCATKTRYDLSVMYAGSTVYTDESLNNLAAKMSEGVDDITGNDKIDAVVRQLGIAPTNTQQAGTEYNYAMSTKLDLEFMSGESYLFLLNKQEADRLIRRDATETVFEEVDKWSTKPVDKDYTLKENGKSYVVNLRYNEYFNNAGFVTENLYMAIRPLKDKPSNEDKLRHDNAVKIANIILGNG